MRERLVSPLVCQVTDRNLQRNSPRILAYRTCSVHKGIKAWRNTHESNGIYSIWATRSSSAQRSRKTCSEGQRSIDKSTCDNGNYRGYHHAEFQAPHPSLAMALGTTLFRY